MYNLYSGMGLPGKKTIKMGLASSEKDNAVQNFNEKLNFLLKILLSAFVLKSVLEEQNLV